MANHRLIARRSFLQGSAALLGAGSVLNAETLAPAADPARAAGADGARQTLTLDGEWQIEDSVDAAEVPKTFGHTVPVPGLAHLAQPAFQDVDLFESRENLWNRVQFGELPKSAWASLPPDAAGVSQQKRNYFWYRKAFRVPARREVAILKINKAQFGTAVWLNGRELGSHVGCFSAGYVDLTDAIKWDGDNELVVRVGAHPGVLPKGAPAGTDFEKRKWTPGIYDRVALLLRDNPVIETIQVAPHISPSEITVQATLKNYAGTPLEFDLTYHVHTWKDHQAVAESTMGRLKLQPNERKAFTGNIRIPGARLWSPEDPFLYVLETRTGGDSDVSRFGMREIRFDTPTKRALLNGQVYFWRGSNITLHRFFEDADSGSLPWDEKWLRKLLVEIPKEMNWNSFRFCIGPVPEQWLDIADEAGLLIQNEFFVWTGHPSWAGGYNRPPWDADEMIRQYGEWMRDNWNHPSVAIWDANNETLDGAFAEKIIPAVRSLDLSGRQWENSYNGPQGPNDPVEDHPYLFSRLWSEQGQAFKMTDLESASGLTPNDIRPPNAHAMINNEYGWLWLNRDGSPTKLTQPVYDKLLGPSASAEQRFALNAYLLGGLTEFWRAYRNYAGVLHFVYLTCSYPGAYTSDHFRDVKHLELEPHFKDYLAEAFKPLGLYINFWQPELEAGSKREFCVMAVNDYNMNVSGDLILSLESEDGMETARRETRWQLPALGQQSYRLSLDLPDKPGSYLLKATARSDRQTSTGPTVSRRRLSLKPGGVPKPTSGSAARPEANSSQFGSE